MTNEEAIKILKSKLDGSVDTSWEWTEAVRMAIEALSNANQHTQRVGCVDCNDLVYRAEVGKLKKKIKSLDSELSVFPSADRPTGWIPVSERLPEEHEWIGTKQFGTTISDKVHITFDVNGERFVKTLSLQNGELSDYEKRTMDTFYKGWKMLAWMPLPEPYKGGEE